MFSLSVGKLEYIIMLISTRITIVAYYVTIIVVTVFTIYWYTIYSNQILLFVRDSLRCVGS